MAFGDFENDVSSLRSMLLVRIGKNVMITTHDIMSITNTNGTPKAIHSPKLMGSGELLINFSAIAFGGVPIGVPIPPRFAAIGMARIKAVLPLSSLGNNFKKGKTIASIIAVVAVLLINIEKHALKVIIPKRMIFGFLPNRLRRIPEMFWSSLYFVAALARKNPPRNSRITGAASVAIISLNDNTVP